MKATGIIRRIDDLGRVVIPKEIRRSMRIREGDPLEIYTTKDGICFRKYSPIGEMDTDTVKKICDQALGRLNYQIFDRDGDSILPLMTYDVRLNIDEPLNENTCTINCEGECIGYLQTPSGNREMVAKIIGALYDN